MRKHHGHHRGVGERLAVDEGERAAVLDGSQASPSGEQSHLQEFLHEALAQQGDSYVFGAKGDPDDPDPHTFDCSGLTQWASERAGFDLKAGAIYQFRQLHGLGKVIPVDEAIHTPGALLFHFDSDPTVGGPPGGAHVAISLGNGMTVEAADPKDGVVSWHATSERFNYAAVIPGISDGTPPSPDVLDAILAGRPVNVQQMKPEPPPVAAPHHEAQVRDEHHLSEHGDPVVAPAHAPSAHPDADHFVAGVHPMSSSGDSLVVLPTVLDSPLGDPLGNAAGLSDPLDAHNAAMSDGGLDHL